MIYLDNAATAKTSARAAEAAVYAMTEAFGNPSALYHFGIEAEKLLDFSRESVASALGGKAEEIIFTSGATESNNTAIFGLAKIYGKRKRRVATTSIEHPSVAEAFKRLGEAGYEIALVRPVNGRISEDALFDAVDENTCLLSAMLVNNETGLVLPVERAFSRIKKARPDCMLHCDCVQGFLKLPFSVKTLGADAVSVSGHKVHAPKGVGALWLKKGVRISPLVVGGGQQKGLRSGTEAVPGIYAFGKVVEELAGSVETRLAHAGEIRDYAIKKLEALGMSVNSPEDGSPYIISAAVPGIKSETALHFLESRGVMVSSGSACSRGKKSAVLTELGFRDSVVDSTIRISTSLETSFSDIDALAEGLAEALEKLVKIRR